MKIVETAVQGRCVGRITVRIKCLVGLKCQLNDCTDRPPTTIMNAIWSRQQLKVLPPSHMMNRVNRYWIVLQTRYKVRYVGFVGSSHISCINFFHGIVQFCS